VAASIFEAKARHEAELLRIPGVVGVGVVGNTLIVYVETAQAAAAVPRRIEGFPVQVRVIGRVRPL